MYYLSYVLSEKKSPIMKYDTLNIPRWLSHAFSHVMLSTPLLSNTHQLTGKPGQTPNSLVS